MSLGLLIAVAIFGLALLPTVVLSPQMPDTQVSGQQILVGGLFSAICLLGVLAAFYPAKCQGMFQKPQNPLPLANTRPLEIKGHHPDCQKYSPNRIKVGGRGVCAACSGLLIGAIASLIGAVLYFFVGLEIVGSIWLLVLGEAFMFLGLAQIWFRSVAKVLMNLLFVVGSFVVLVEADLLGKSLVVDLYVLGLIVFVLWLRILLSQWHNRRTCQTCRQCF